MNCETVDSVPSPGPTPAPSAREPGSQTILLVEDEPAILSMVRTLLTRQGYSVLAAASPSEAVRLAKAHAGTIDLLVSDMLMPEMAGSELAKILAGIHPSMKRLFMSGHGAEILERQGVAGEGALFIQKPFAMKEMAGKVREALGIP